MPCNSEIRLGRVFGVSTKKDEKKKQYCISSLKLKSLSTCAWPGYYLTELQDIC